MSEKMTQVFSGIVIPVSTIDWYGRSASVVFFNGCNFNCIYCSNKNFIDISDRLEPLFRKGNVVDIEEIEKQIRDARAFISAVVFSGGEPTAHPRRGRRCRSCCGRGEQGGTRRRPGPSIGRRRWRRDEHRGGRPRSSRVRLAAPLGPRWARVSKAQAWPAAGGSAVSRSR